MKKLVTLLHVGAELTVVERSLIPVTKTGKCLVTVLSHVVTPASAIAWQNTETTLLFWKFSIVIWLIVFVFDFVVFLLVVVGILILFFCPVQPFYNVKTF